MNLNFWQGKRVFITGHTGFKGSWLSLWLQQFGAEVSGYSLAPTTKQNLFDISSIARNMSSYIGDIRDSRKLKQVMLEVNPEIVIHLAAQPLVRYSYAEPVETYATNVMGTVHMLEAVRACKQVRVVLSITSDKCYENHETQESFTEDSPLGGYDPYSSSKGCAELVTSAYRKSFFNPHKYSEHGVSVASARAGNVIGGGDWALDRLIPDIMNSIRFNKTVIIRNPHSIRPWQHVLEPLGGYLLLAEKMYKDGVKFSGAWNFGPEDEDAKAVGWIVEQLVKTWGANAKWEVQSDSTLHEAKYLKLNCTKSKDLLGWSPVWNLEQCLSQIVLWYRELGSNQDMRQVTMKQIESYTNEYLNLMEGKCDL